MRFIAGFRAASLTGAAIMLLSGGDALAQGFGGGGFGGGGFHGGGPPSMAAGVGVGAYAPGQGPVGARGFWGGGFHGYQPVIGFWGGYGGYGGYGGSDIGESYVPPGGNATVYNYYYHDARRRDGGFYGGGGVFYADDGYSRLNAVRRSSARGEYDDGAPDYALAPIYRPAQHIFYLPTNYNRGAHRHNRRVTQY